MASTMKAIAYSAYGGPEVTKLMELPLPTPRAGDVTVRVAAGSLNPVDKHQRNGTFKALIPYSFPAIGGNEFSGVVTALGEGVDRFAVGDSVVCRTEKTAMRAFAEYTTMPAHLCAKAPTTMPLTDAAGLPLASVTAEQCLDLLEVKAGDRVLVTGGAGGVGLFAIQLAKLRGAHVTTTASDAGKPFVEKAGADEVVNYKTTKLADMPQKWTKVLDAAGGDDAILNDVLPAVEDGGKIISIAGPQSPGCFDGVLSWWMKPVINLVIWARARTVLNAAATRNITYQWWFMVPNGDQLAKLVGYVDEGKLVVNIDSRFKMAEFKDAYERLESGRCKGKIVLEIGGNP
ncbi:hypothetical protein CspeluHIS016_0500210 [Cutaneotrichosporon spelunceum]|uniref:Enoyl reductase (ER) domain-containing protein n=1 Tax=Cutaneotrichosporon spelunceum TaxID=1672016 RepID=A0AAD3TW62_9TREE|nr:hypothetical protein CspeluHIS016_0500210 [Cutaneotrichosporon spelunceum]